uniref:Tc1-like transposase DDE domain-containing protein n=1 Tax=Chromera velia CCMP2878 TaxID=1169474 RepID=A0A0G4HPH4_9ALVE|eukprot:Cvel_7837.t1-p1 / transcript=Cvel_7837.t1 / gene=Cvel_7837 / organism=Chromera_velia_CCMP2878 / gene_product=hypothetical protein / transcript_product=hypothetical protein / location=Cvel_scaffold419:19569-20585(+) / protein_length=339 / sequence_SO=supercontig / SO=protein_coding / is_pseudo=false
MPNYGVIAAPLRNRAVELWLIGVSICKICLWLGFSRSTFSRISDRWRNRELWFKYKGGSPKRRLSFDKLVQVVLPFVLSNTCVPIRKAARLLEDELGFKSTVRQLLDGYHRLHLTRKRLRQRAREIRYVDEEVFRLTVDGIPAECFLVVDVCQFTRTDAVPLMGWAPSGVPLVRPGKQEMKSDRLKAILAVSVEKVLPVFTTRRSSITGEFFSLWVEAIIPYMSAYPGPLSVLVWDNAAFHLADYVRAKLAQIGAILIPLPPYCPHFSPCELIIGIFRWLLRSDDFIPHALSEDPKYTVEEAVHSASDLVEERHLRWAFWRYGVYGSFYEGPKFDNMIT